MQIKKENTGFNIRKISKKRNSLGKTPEEHAVYSLEDEFQKSSETQVYQRAYQPASESKREKHFLLDQKVNESILNSATYQELKKQQQTNKKNNDKRLNETYEELDALEQEKKQLLAQSEKVNAEKIEIAKMMEELKEEIRQTRIINLRKKQELQHNENMQAEYFNSLILSMRFHAEYEHDIDPDNMTYEQLLELEEKIGSVSKGLSAQKIQQLPKFALTQKEIAPDENCTVCYCNFEVEEIVTRLDNCLHQFHFDCLKTWLEKEKICPLCKQEIFPEVKPVKKMIKSDVTPKV